VPIHTLLCEFAEHADRASRLATRGRGAFDSDEFLQLASEAILIRLGEIVARIDHDHPSFIDEHPELELRQLKNARNKIAHGYDSVNYNTVWAIVSEHIPRVGREVKAFLAI
jgi:uncharacterized protein with HEPN domain